VSTRTALAFKGWRAGQVVPQLKTSYKDGTTPPISSWNRWSSWSVAVEDNVKRMDQQRLCMGAVMLE
jgi:hypothetical protein